MEIPFFAKLHFMRERVKKVDKSTPRVNIDPAVESPERANIARCVRSHFLVVENVETAQSVYHRR